MGFCDKPLRVNGSVHLEDVDVILGMDIITRLDVQISGRAREAIPRPEHMTSEILKLNQKVVIPAGKSRVFFVTNPGTSLTLFEPSDKLPEGLLGLPTLSEGSRVAVQLDNLTEGEYYSHTRVGSRSYLLC